MSVEERKGSFDVGLDKGGIPAEYRKGVYGALGFLAIYVVARGIVGAAAKPLWYDELLTLTIAGQPSLHQLWAAVSRGFDSGPPLFYLIERAALSVTSKKEIALRLPAIFAFAGTLGCVFVYAKKRSGELVAILSTLAMLTTLLFQMYSIEARSYSMVMACVAFALVCYQRLPSWRWAALLGASFFVAESLHYYAVLAMVPFWLAEAMVLVKTKKIRWAVWAALVCGLVPLAIFWKLTAQMKELYGNEEFLHPGFTTLPNYYGAYFYCGDVYGVAAALVAVAGVMWLSRQQREEGVERERELGESVLLVSLIALPLIEFLLVRVMHGGLLSRYPMAATLGIVLGIAGLLTVTDRRAVAAFAIFILVSVGIREFRFWHHGGQDPLAVNYAASSFQRFLHSAGHEDLPIVVTHGLTYGECAYYSPQAMTERLIYLVDHGNDMKYGGPDVLLRALPYIPESFHFRVADYAEFVSAHREFLLYSGGGEVLDQRLRRDRFSLHLAAVGGDGQIYLVKADENAAR